MDYKKYFPYVLVFFGVLFFLFSFFVLRPLLTKTSKTKSDEEFSYEVPFEKRPFVSLIPTKDGHWLNLKIENLKIEGAYSVDYELLYTLPDGRMQGVPGTIVLDTEGQVIKRELLLGSESSGKFRYDEGVKEGTLSLRFRDREGKLITRFSTTFLLLKGEDVDFESGLFSGKVKKSKNSPYFVVMKTFGFSLQPEKTQNIIGPFGVFSSDQSLSFESISISEGKNIYFFDGKEHIKEPSIFSPGVYYSFPE